MDKRDFIRSKIAEGTKPVHTRFPPEPNGYLHIGHAKAICLNFDVAKEYNGKCNLRMDDTNPTKGYEQYISTIQEDVRWLGYDWEDRLFFASDYFDILYKHACTLIHKGLAYVDHQTPDEIRENRGTPTEVGKNSPFRDRSVSENLELFTAMKAGKYKDGECVLRAKIDMASPNITMRDPTIYRIRHVEHPRCGNKWCIYPLYDFTHCLSDAQEGITYSLCTLEFEGNRPLYNWFLKQLDIKDPPEQTEFARLNISYTVLSKRKLARLVQENYVRSWDDPRMPTLAGLRRRGYPPEVLREFCSDVGITKVESVIDVSRLESMLRNSLNLSAPRRVAVLNPLKVCISNYPEDKEEIFEVENNPEDSSAGTRPLPFSKHIYIEREDFMKEPTKGFFRLSPGTMVRLKYAYCVRCVDFSCNANGEVEEVFCEYDPETRGGDSKGMKIKGTLHWLSISACEEVQVHMYERLFLDEMPEEKEDFITSLNPDSLKIINALVETGHAIAGHTPYQFLRHGYFCLDTSSNKEKLILNRIISLKDSWKKCLEKKGK